MLCLLAACTPAAQKLSDKSPLDAAAGKAEQLIRLGDSTRASGNTEAAAELYRQAIAQSKDSPQAYLSLASLYRQQKQHDNALQILRDAQARFPEDARVQAELGYALVAANKTAEALPLLEKALAHTPEDPALFNARGVALDLLERHTEAQASYRKGLSIAPASPALQNNLALSLILDKRYEEAISLLQGLVSSRSATPTIRQNLALAYGLKGDSVKALEYASKDLPAEQAQENLKFYTYYSRALQEHAPAVQSAPVAEVVESVEFIITPEAVQPSEAAAPLPEEAAPSAGATVQDIPEGAVILQRNHAQP